MIKCSKCQSDNPVEAKFCNACGAKLERICSACGTVNPIGSNFCNQCGHDLRKKSQTAKADATARAYTPKFISDNFLTKRTAVEGERKPATVMFADVANSMGLFENLDPEEVHWIMDRCFKLLMDEIHRYEGTVNQFMGDGIMALFGVPVAHEDHAQRACHAALAIQQAMVEYGEKVRKGFGVDFQIRIGLNSGSMIVGAIGDDLRKDYTAVGNTVNLASRIEHLARPGTIAVSKDTYRLTKDYFVFAPLGSFEVKGIRDPQEIFELQKADESLTAMEASSKKGLTQFVGRANSMAALMDAFEKTRNGSGQVVGVIGEAGAGKSRLVYEFQQRLPLGQFGLIQGRCVHYGSTIPYLPVIDVLKSFFEINEGEQEMVSQQQVLKKMAYLYENAQQMAPMVPPIQDLLSLTVQDDTYLELAPERRKERIFETLRDLIVRGSQKRPLIIVVEDLHWIDKASEAFMDYFIGWLAPLKVMLVLLHRPEYTPLWTSRSYYTRIGVIHLSRQSSTALVDAILADGEVSPQIYDLILKRSAGNPLFIEEMVHAFVEDGTIRKEGNRYLIAPRPTDLQIPDTIHGIIAARIDRLEDSVKKLMQLASVIGREFAFGILQVISDRNEDLKSQLQNLQSMELIYEKSLFPELEFVFKHALTVEVTYNSLLSKKRREIHTSIGQAIEALYADKLEEYYEVLAYHFAKGEQTDKASHYLKCSGKKAVRNHALWEAYSFYKQAVEQLNQWPDSNQKKSELIEVIQLMGLPMSLLGFPEDALVFLEIGERLAREMDDIRNLASFYTLMGTYHSHAGNHMTAIKYIEEGFEKARTTGVIELMAPLGLTICTSYSATSQYERLMDAMPDIIGLIEKSGRTSDFFSVSLNPYSYIGGACGAALGHMGQFKEGDAFLTKALSNAIAIGNAATLGATRFNYGWMLYAKGDFSEAKRHLEECVPLFEKARWHLGVAMTSCLIGHANLFLGDSDRGIEQAENGIRMFRERNIELYLAWCKWVVGSIYLDLGAPEKAEPHLKEALDLSSKNNEQGVRGLSLVALGRTGALKVPQQADQARQSMAAGLEILDALKMRPWVAQGNLFMGESWLHAGNRDNAKRALQTAEALFRKMEMTFWLDRALDLLATV